MIDKDYELKMELLKKKPIEHIYSELLKIVVKDENEIVKPLMELIKYIENNYEV